MVNFETCFPADCEGVIVFLIRCLDPRVFLLASGLCAELFEVETDACGPLAANIVAKES